MLCDVENKKYKQYILAAGNSAACLFTTLPSLPPLPSYMLSPLPTSTSPFLHPTSFSSSLAPSSPVSRPTPAPLLNSATSAPLLPSTSLPLLPHPSPFASCPSPSYHPLTCPPHPASLYYSSPSYHHPTIPSLLVSLHSLLLRMCESGSCLILLELLAINVSRNQDWTL